jgi:hypothetical protein
VYLKAVTLEKVFVNAKIRPRNRYYDDYAVFVV